ncbi:MAG TPA: hypothetical protein VMB18_03745 [Terriglobales bacterium]|nr:hypothetical protein [Terriglobales bacterium]
MTETAKATITVDDKIVTFEGPQTFVDSQVSKYIRTPETSNRDMNRAGVDEVSELKTNAGVSEEQLVLAKKPKGHSEIIAVLAFSLAQAGVTEFTEEDIRKAYIRARVRPPKVVGQAIRDAKKSFDYIDAGSKRGTYKLSNHGDRTVRFDLPRVSGTEG